MGMNDGSARQHIAYVLFNVRIARIVEQQAGAGASVRQQSANDSKEYRNKNGAYEKEEGCFIQQNIERIFAGDGKNISYMHD